MAFEPYLQPGYRGCFRSPLAYAGKTPGLTPECSVDTYTKYFRDRWDILNQRDACSIAGKKPNPLCIRDVEHSSKLSEVPPPCVSPKYENWISHHNKTYVHHKSHNDVDDCCKASCPCQLLIQKKPDIRYKCKEPEEYKEPLEDCTTYRAEFREKGPLQDPPKRFSRREAYDPCECPLESATSYRLDYPHKSHQPNGPAVAEATKQGLWSMDQFSLEPFPEDTEQKSQFSEKYCPRRGLLKTESSLCSGTGPSERITETCAQYPIRQSDQLPEIPRWLQKEHWIPPEPQLETCTTYNHFYQPYPILKDDKAEIRTPGAIPFPTLHNMWYTCCDPKVDQRTPVEMQDNDPWPYVKPCPIRYQDNLVTDPCAPFRDETTQKYDYTTKAHWSKLQSTRPLQGYTPPILPFNDDTTNRCSFRAYSPEEYKGAKIEPGNPDGKYWGPFKCKPNVDLCLPRFPAPYGHPLKPYSKPCPCGSFDDRSTYHNDFKFRSREMVELLNEEMCEQPGLPKGATLYRHDFIAQGGKKAAKMPPPPGKGYRCIHPCNVRDLDTLYRLDYHDYWNSISRKNLEMYRAKPTIRNRRQKEVDEEMRLKAGGEGQGDFEIFATPPGTTLQDVLDGKVSLKNQD